ncbi:MAG: hypothetical protein IJ215_05930 [Clostridia bacterium]|nr:hypothetical protein [Clostridia bacterium]
MKKNFWIFMIVIFIILAFIFFWWKGVGRVQEDITEKESEPIVQHDSAFDEEYDVDIDDETITFTSKDGKTAIIYVFDNDHLDNVLYVVAVEDENAAEYLKNEYEKQVGNGIIDRVVSSENIVSIKYDKSYFEEYSNYTKDEIQDLLINNDFTTIIEDD